MSDDLTGPDYPDLEAPEDMDGVTALQRVKGMGVVRRINWGEEYQSWHPTRKIEYLEKFGASMNHAADVMQRERNAFAERVKVLEKLVDALKASREDMQKLMVREINKANGEKELLNQRIVELTTELKAVTITLESLTS